MAAEVERRRRGTGSVYPEGDGWRYALPRRARGRGLEGRRRCPTRSQAEAALEGALDALERRGDPGGQTLDDWLAAWLASVRSKVRASTWASYEGHARLHISPLLGGIPLRELRAADVMRLEAALLASRSHRGKRKTAPTISPNTAARVLTTLRIALAAAVRAEAVPHNVAALTGRLPRAERDEVEAMTPATAALYREAFRETWLGPLVRLLLGTGLRLGEALSLDQGDVGPAEAWVRIRRSKTRVRAVPVARGDARQAIRDALAECPVRGAREPLFWSPRRNLRGRGQRGRLAVASVSHAVPELAEAAGLPRITPHGFRHGAATIMVAGGAHMRLVAAQLGHANPALTARVYAHVVPEAQAEAADLLGSAEASAERD